MPSQYKQNTQRQQFLMAVLRRASSPCSTPTAGMEDGKSSYWLFMGGVLVNKTI